MTYEEALKHYQENVCRFCRAKHCENCPTATAKTAMGKQIPKKPHFEGDGYWNGEFVYDTWVCPNCDTDYEVETDTHKYCPNCGQKIDWSEEE